MLTKLRFFQLHSSEELASLRASVQPALWCEHLDAEVGSLRALGGGTLNMSFAGRSKDRSPKYFKTHLTEAGRLRLRNEATILEALYGERLGIRYVSSNERDWLVMSLLAPLEANDETDVSPDWIERTISRATSTGCIPPLDESFIDVLRAAQNALVFLVDKNQITTALASRVDEELYKLQSKIDRLDPHPCHGDLGPLNLMRDSQGLILLDWEDVFQGVRGYDWIYWISFFRNRHFLTSNHLLRSGIPERSSRAVLLAILLVKCELSVRSGSIGGNNMSIEHRLREAIVSV